MTPLGYILLPLGVAGLLVSPRWLYRLFVFWTLFSATSVLNVGEAQNGSAVQVWMFFGALWILRLGLERVSLFSFSIDNRLKRTSFWMIAFLVVATISLVMPVLIDGSLLIAAPTFEGDPTPLVLTGHNITQLLYLIFGGTLAICVAHANLTDDNREETERVILYSGIFLACWGIFQFLCNITGLPYPDFLLNNSGSASGQGFRQALKDIGVQRVSSAAVEPSVLAQALLSLLPLTLPAWLKRGFVFSRRRDRLVALLFVVVLILSTSSVAYVGLAILGLTYVVYSVRTGRFSKRKAIAVFVPVGILATAIVAVAIISVPFVSQIADSVLLSKASSGSAIERAMTISYAFGYFQKYPILGIGWGSATSHDVIVKLLSNVGIVGTVVGFLGIFSIVRSNWRRISRGNSPLELSREAWLMSLVSFVLTSVLIEFPLPFGNFWLIIGMSMATAATARGLPVAARARPAVANAPLRTEP
jgi:O-Antigen ligase